MYNILFLMNMDWTLPIKNPVLVYSIVLFVIFLSQIVLSRIKIPSILGPILAGLAFGPHGLNLLARNSAIELFGTVGLLYIMFMAGLELDMAEFKKNKYKSMLFGFLTFSAPLGMGMIACMYLLDYPVMSSLLIASMFATHTLVAYPLVSKLGISKNIAVTISVGGTIITDTLVLLILAVITGYSAGEMNADYWIRFGITIFVYALAVIILYPLIGRWFFRNVKGEGTAHYIFVLALVFLASFGAELAGMEAIIGAFLSGLVLNQLIPHTSPLMNRIEFVGNAIFIPFFLLSVGMLVDLTVLFQGTEAIFVAIVLSGIAISGKWVAAWLTSKILKFTKQQEQLVFGLSTAHAAATIAVILVGFKIGIINESVLNGTIILILITCLLSSFVVENAGRKIAVSNTEKTFHPVRTGERILIPISNPATIDSLMEFASMVKDTYSREPLFPLTVVEDDQQTAQKILSGQKMLEKAVHYASSIEKRTEILTRVDYNVANCINRTTKELLITDIVIGWSRKVKPMDKIFGSILDNVVSNSRSQVIYVCRFANSLNTYKKVILIIPENAHCEGGFTEVVSKIHHFTKVMGAKLVCYCSQKTKEALTNLSRQSRSALNVNYSAFTDWEDFLIISRDVGPNDFVILLSARKGTVSYNSYLDNIPSKLHKHFTENSFCIIYPKQEEIFETQDLAEGEVREQLV